MEASVSQTSRDRSWLKGFLTYVFYQLVVLGILAIGWAAYPMKYGLPEIIVFLLMVVIAVIGFSRKEDEVIYACMAPVLVLGVAWLLTYKMQPWIPVEAWKLTAVVGAPWWLIVCSAMCGSASKVIAGG